MRVTIIMAVNSQQPVDSGSTLRGLLICQVILCVSILSKENQMERIHVLLGARFVCLRQAVIYSICCMTACEVYLISYPVGFHL